MSGGGYRVEMLEAAETDLEVTLDWLVDNKPELALHSEGDVRRGVLSLARFPARCPRLHSGEPELADLRKLVLDQDVVPFRIAGQRVLVLRVLHEGREFGLH